jgi:hypothetical protein
MFTISAAADNSGNGNVVLSFDFSDNSAPASVSLPPVADNSGNSNNGAFYVIANVLPEHTGGVVRMVAVAPDNSGVSNLVCPFQPVQQSEVECAFNFTSNGVWTVKAQYAPDAKSDVASVSITRLRVAN